MRKEIFVAIIIGGIIGLLIAFGIWRANAVLQPKDNPIEIKEENNTKDLNQVKDLSLSISSPKDFDVLTENPVLVTGITKEGSVVVLSSEDEDYLIFTQDGSISQEVDLSGGVNQIKIEAFSEDTSVEKLLTLVFSSEFDIDLNENDDEGTATDEADTIRQKVKEKIENIRKNPQAYIGSITDKTDDTLQIQNINGEIQLAAITDDVTYVKLNGNSQNIEFSDIAIGDFIAALGFANGNKVLETKRVIVSDPIGDNGKTVVKGIIKEIDGKDITITGSLGDYNLTFPRRWKGPEIKDLAEGEEVIAVYTPVEGKDTIRTIAKVNEIISSE